MLFAVPSASIVNQVQSVELSIPLVRTEVNQRMLPGFHEF